MRLAKLRFRQGEREKRRVVVVVVTTCVVVSARNTGVGGEGKGDSKCIRVISRE